MLIESLSSSKLINFKLSEQHNLQQSASPPMADSVCPYPELMVETKLCSSYSQQASSAKSDIMLNNTEGYSGRLERVINGSKVVSTTNYFSGNPQNVAKPLLGSDIGTKQALFVIDEIAKLRAKRSFSDNPSDPTYDAVETLFLFDQLQQRQAFGHGREPQHMPLPVGSAPALHDILGLTYARAYTENIGQLTWQNSVEDSSTALLLMRSLEAHHRTLLKQGMLTRVKTTGKNAPAVPRVKPHALRRDALNAFMEAQQRRMLLERGSAHNMRNTTCDLWAIIDGHESHLASTSREESGRQKADQVLNLIFVAARLFPLSTAFEVADYESSTSPSDGKYDIALAQQPLPAISKLMTGASMSEKDGADVQRVALPQEDQPIAPWDQCQYAGTASSRRRVTDPVSMSLSSQSSSCRSSSTRNSSLGSLAARTSDQCRMTRRYELENYRPASLCIDGPSMVNVQSQDQWPYSQGLTSETNNNQGPDPATPNTVANMTSVLESVRQQHDCDYRTAADQHDIDTADLALAPAQPTQFCGQFDHFGSKTDTESSSTRSSLNDTSCEMFGEPIAVDHVPDLSCLNDEVQHSSVRDSGTLNLGRQVFGMSQEQEGFPPGCSTQDHKRTSGNATVASLRRRTKGLTAKITAMQAYVLRRCTGSGTADAEIASNNVSCAEVCSTNIADVETGSIFGLVPAPLGRDHGNISNRSPGSAVHDDSYHIRRLPASLSTFAYRSNTLLEKSAKVFGGMTRNTR